MALISADYSPPEGQNHYHGLEAHVNPATYIRPGDEIAVVYRDTKLSGFCGRVLESEGTEYGRRTFIIEKTGEELLKFGAVGVLESSAVFTVNRGDSWVGLPLPMLIEEAEIKSARNEKNERQRIVKKAPLFSDQIAVRTIDPALWIEKTMTEGAENLDRDHKAAIEANRIRGLVEARIKPEDSATLREKRLKYPKDPTFGIKFWMTQLNHLNEHGDIERSDGAIVTMAEKLDLPWLHYGARLTWVRSPQGPLPVRVLWVGPQRALCQIIGTARIDYDPRLFPDGTNVMLEPGDIAELPEALGSPDSEANECATAL